MARYTSSTNVSIPANATNVSVTVAGARGGTGGNDGNPGGTGGAGRVGTFSLSSFTARTLTLNIGGVGSNGSGCCSNCGGASGGSGVANGGSGGYTGPQGCSGSGAGGGGATGVYDSVANAWIVVAGGGGGGGGASYPDSYLRGGNGGAGGGWNSGISTISNGGNGLSQGFDGGGGGGGGGGAPGGGGGREGADDRAGRYASGGGGGGSSAYNGSYAFWTGSSSTNSGGGYVDVTYTLVSPTVDSFTATPAEIIRGQSTTLAWSTSNATSASINQGIGAVNVNGSTVVSPSNDTTYTITAFGPGNTSAVRNVTVVVYEPPTVTLSLNRSSIISGECTTLSWNTTGDADTIAFNPPGSGNANLTSFVTVCPTVTTTYTAQVSGKGGTDTDSITLTVYQPPTASITGPESLLYNQQGTLTYSSTYSNLSLTITPVYSYTNGSVTGTVINLPRPNSAEFNVGTTSVSGSITTEIPYNTQGPRSVQYIIEAQGNGGQATDTVTVDIIIDETPDNIIIPETEDAFKNQDPVISPDTDVFSELLEIADIDIPVEVKSNKPIQVDINGQQDWKNLRQL